MLTKSDALAVSLALVGLLIPVALSVYLADRWTTAEESARLGVYARQLQERVGLIRNEARAAVDALERARTYDPCAESQIALMDQLEMSSPHLQKLGYIEGDRFVCSSFGRRSIDWRISQSYRVVGPRGLEVRTGVKIDQVPGQTFVLTQRKGYFAILSEDALVDITSEPKDVALAFYTLGLNVVAQRGLVDSAWVTRAKENTSSFFVEDGFFVAVVMSDIWTGVAVVAEPVAYLEDRKAKLRLLVVPFGLIAGLGVAASILSQLRRRLTIEALLVNALKQDEFFLHYQPLIDLRSGQCAGAEALIRWRQADGTLVRPDEFIPVAEKTGLIKKITERVMAICEREAAPLLLRHPGLHIAINLSAADIMSARTPQRLANLTTKTGTLPSNWIVEVTERGIINSQACRDSLLAIRKQNIPIAIDDFGTGYSSLSYLGLFKLDYLKIDKSFVDAIGTDVATKHVAFHIIEMAKSLGLAMIAEGVETDVQADELRSRGVQFAQGWLFAKAMPIDELEAYVVARNAPPECLPPEQ